VVSEINRWQNRQRQQATKRLQSATRTNPSKTTTPPQAAPTRQATLHDSHNGGENIVDTLRRKRQEYTNYENLWQHNGAQISVRSVPRSKRILRDEEADGTPTKRTKTAHMSLVRQAAR